MKILASDFDGTLYFPKEGGLRPGDIQAIEAFQARGNKFGLCTGRPLKGVLGMLGDKVHPDFYVLCSGALVLTGDLQPIYARPMDPQGVNRVLGFWQGCRDQGVQLVAFTLGEIYLPDSFCQSPYVQKDPLMSQIARPISQLQDQGGAVYGISLTARDPQAAAALLQQMEQAGVLAGCQGFQNAASIDLVAAGCSKRRGLEQLKAHYGLEQPIACIGDSYNDLPMLEATPLSFTFRSSPAPVREKAAYTVDSEAQAIALLMENA